MAIIDFHKSGEEVDVAAVGARLQAFERDTPADYKLAASEGVNSTKARQIRNDHIVKMFV